MYNAVMFELDLAGLVRPSRSGGVPADAARVNRGLALAAVATGSRVREPLDRASALALESFEKAFAWHGGPGPVLETEARMFAAAHHVHDLLSEPSHAQRARDTRSTSIVVTLTAIAFAPGHAVVASIGDCRAFRIHAGDVEPISAGAATDMNALGVPPGDLEIDTFTVPAEPGDVFVVCTGATWDVLSSAILVRAAGSETASAACEALHHAVIATANVEHVAVAVARLVPHTLRASKPEIKPRPHQDSTPPPDPTAASAWRER